MDENRFIMSNVANNGVKIICTIAMIAMVLVSIAIYHASIMGILLFLLFAFFYVQLPGLLIVRMLDICIKNISSNLLISFFTGWALIVIEYFLSISLNNNLILISLGPLLSVIYITISIKYYIITKSTFQINLKSIPTALLIYTVLVMLYVFLVTQFVYMSTKYASSISMSIDKAFQMGLITSITHGFPVANPWIAGRLVSYHIFSQILLSVPVSVFGLDADFVIMSCAPYLTTYLLTLSSYSLFRHFCNNKGRAGLYALSIMLAHLFAARDLSTSYLFRVIIGNDNYGGFALASMVSCVIALDMCFQKSSKKSFASALLVFALLLSLLSGIKAPVALDLIGGLIGTAILGLIMKRIPVIRTVMLVSLSLLAFISVYNALLNLTGSSGSSGSSIFALGDMTNICFWKKDFIALLKNIGIPVPARYVLLMLAFTTSFLTVYTLPFIIGYVRELILVLRGVSAFSFARVFVYASSFVGFAMMLLLRYEGHSQVYFGSVLMFFAPLIAFWFFEDVGLSSCKFTRVAAAISKVWFFSLIILTSISLALGFKNMLPDAIKHADPTSNFNPYLSLSRGEYEATSWIKKSVPYDTLISTQMYSSVSDDDYDVSNRWNNCHFVYAAFSDHLFYLEGSGFSFDESETEKRIEMVKNTKALYDPDNTSRGSLARELRIEYVMVTKKLHPTSDLSSDDYDLVFTNEDVDIYKVND